MYKCAHIPLNKSVVVSTQFPYTSSLDSTDIGSSYFFANLQEEVIMLYFEFFMFLYWKHCTDDCTLATQEQLKALGGGWRCSIAKLPHHWGRGKHSLIIVFRLYRLQAVQAKTYNRSSLFHQLVNPVCLPCLGVALTAHHCWLTDHVELWVTWIEGAESLEEFETCRDLEQLF